MKKYDHHLSSGVEIFVAPWVGRGKALELMPEHQYVLLSFKDDHYLSLFFLPMPISLALSHTLLLKFSEWLFFFCSFFRCISFFYLSFHQWQFMFSMEVLFE